jgi:hypothetical protein
VAFAFGLARVPSSSESRIRCALLLCVLAARADRDALAWRPASDPGSPNVYRRDEFSSFCDRSFVVARPGPSRVQVRGSRARNRRWARVYKDSVKRNAIFSCAVAVTQVFVPIQNETTRPRAAAARGLWASARGARPASFRPSRCACSRARASHAAANAPPCHRAPVRPIAHSRRTSRRDACRAADAPPRHRARVRPTAHSRRTSRRDACLACDVQWPRRCVRTLATYSGHTAASAHPRRTVALPLRLRLRTYSGPTAASASLRRTVAPPLRPRRFSRIARGCRLRSSYHIHCTPASPPFPLPPARVRPRAWHRLTCRPRHRPLCPDRTAPWHQHVCLYTYKHLQHTHTYMGWDSYARLCAAQGPGPEAHSPARVRLSQQSH